MTRCYIVYGVRPYKEVRTWNELDSWFKIVAQCDLDEPRVWWFFLFSSRPWSIIDHRRPGSDGMGAWILR